MARSQRTTGRLGAIAGAGMVLAIGIVVAPCGARADEVRFHGPHPLGPGSWDTSTGLHVAPTLGPATEDELAVIDGVHVFVGDPWLYGFTGAVWIFDGMHPLPGGLAGYCAREGSHRHAFAPDARDYAESSSDGVTRYRFTGALRGGWPSFRARRQADAIVGPTACDAGCDAYDATALLPAVYPYPALLPRWRSTRRAAAPPPPRAPVVVTRRPRPEPRRAMVTPEPLGLVPPRDRSVTGRPADRRRGGRR